MGSIKNISGHAESLDDGRSVPIGETAEDVDTNSTTVIRLVEEGRALVLVADPPPKPPKVLKAEDGKDNA